MTFVVLLEAFWHPKSSQNVTGPLAGTVWDPPGPPGSILEAPGLILEAPGVDFGAYGTDFGASGVYFRASGPDFGSILHQLGQKAEKR